MLSQFTAQPEAMSLWAMLGGGLLAFVSPCVLPMLPIYAIYLVGGAKEGENGRFIVLRRCLGFMLGFILFFTIIGAGAGALGMFLKRIDKMTLNLIMGGLMLIFGLWMIDIIHPKTVQMPSFIQKHHPVMSGFFGSFMFGLLIALSWTPCLTPVLANALMLAASADNATMMSGIISLVVFGLGLCIPMIVIMLFYQWLKGALGWLRNHQQLIRRIGGGVMIAYAIYLIVTAFI